MVLWQKAFDRYVQMVAMSRAFQYFGSQLLKRLFVSKGEKGQCLRESSGCPFAE
jgi:hypothetical protein